MALKRVNLLKSHPQKILNKIASREKFGEYFRLAGFGALVIRRWAE
jgi:hypothetical protein